MTGDRIRAMLLTGFGTGYAPIASGTFGTLPGVAVAVVLGALVPASALGLVLLGLGGVLFAWACTQSAFIARTWPREDPGQVVLDEVVGYLVAVGIFAVVSGTPGPWAHVLAFFAFRAFDVLKVPPADRLEEMDGAFGVMADDVAAGVYTAGVLLVADAFAFLA